jgi:radical SAM superfamily enzyme YgiQ (UPF0313 family)
MRYEGQMYRPPSEWQSYLLQVTIGCSHNACTFCGMFKDKRYRERPLDEIFEDLAMAKAAYGHVDQVFLCDGDALSRSTDDLLAIVREIRRTFPHVREIATYASARGVLRKTPEELALLHAEGIGKAYLGVESGDEQTLRDTHKGVTVAQTAAAGKALVDAGFELYAIVLVGLAGRARSRENAEATARIVNEMRPQHLAAMTYMPVPGTPLYRDIERGAFEVLDDRGCLQETRWLVEGLDERPMHFTSSHASNYLPLEGDLARDKARILGLLDGALEGGAPGRRREGMRGL